MNSNNNFNRNGERILNQGDVYDINDKNEINLNQEDSINYEKILNTQNVFLFFIVYYCLLRLFIFLLVLRKY